MGTVRNIIHIIGKTKSYDADAQAFITAAGITDATQKSAVNQLVLDLKSYSIWTKMKAIYPIIGGTATSHKFNLKNPADTNAAFRLVFSGGWTHSSTGMLPNGTNAYADTFFKPTNFISSNNSSISVYQTNPQTGQMGGCYIALTGFTLFGADVNYVDLRLNVNYPTTATILNYSSNGKGLFTTSKSSSTSIRAFKNGTFIGALSETAAAISTNIILSARSNNGVASLYDSTIQKFISFGDGLTDTEAANLYTAVQTYQTTLGRQV